MPSEKLSESPIVNPSGNAGETPSEKATPKAPSPRHLPSERPGPAGGKRDVNRRQRTAEIATAGLRLFLQSGIAAVTIDEIARVAGVAKGSYYRYFKSKADLVDALVEPLAADVRVALAACDDRVAAADANSLAAAYLLLAMDMASLLSEHADLVRLYLQESRGSATPERRAFGALAKHISEAAVELTEVATAHGLLRPLNPRVTALSVVGATERLLYGYLSGEELGDPESITSAVVAMVLEGLRP